MISAEEWMYTSDHSSQNFFPDQLIDIMNIKMLHPKELSFQKWFWSMKTPTQVKFEKRALIYTEKYKGSVSVTFGAALPASWKTFDWL